MASDCSELEDDAQEELVAQDPDAQTVQHERILKLLKAARHQLTDSVHAYSIFEDRDVEKLTNTLRYLSERAGAQWSHSFNKLFSHVHSMNVCPTDMSTKQSKRQKKWKCDACGRYETGCRHELNLAGSLSFNPKNWWKGVCSNVDAWKSFDKEYTELSNATSMNKQDFGTVFVGKTCLRKAKLQFQVNTFVLELYYMTQQDLLKHGHRFRPHSDDEHAAQYAAEMKRMRKIAQKMDKLLSSIESAIGSEGIVPPVVEEDHDLWKRIKRLRTTFAFASNTSVDRVVHNRTRRLLDEGPEAVLNTEEVEDMDEEEEEEGDDEQEYSDDDDDDDSFIVNDEEVEEEADDYEYFDEAKAAAPAASRSNEHAKRSGNRKRAVVRDGDSDQEEQPTREQASSGAGPSSAGQSSNVGRKRCSVVLEEDDDGGGDQACGADRVTVPPKRVRKSKRVRQMAPDEASSSEGAPAAAAYPWAARAGSATGEVPAAAEALGNLCNAAWTATSGARGRPPSTARSVACEMRIPAASGSSAEASASSGAAPRLGSRRAVLMDLMNLKASLFAEGRDADAARLARIEITLLELLEASEEREKTATRGAPH